MLSVMGDCQIGVLVVAWWCGTRPGRGAAAHCYAGTFARVSGLWVTIHVNLFKDCLCDFRHGGGDTDSPSMLRMPHSALHLRAVGVTLSRERHNATWSTLPRLLALAGDDSLVGWVLDPVRQLHSVLGERWQLDHPREVACVVLLHNADNLGGARALRAGAAVFGSGLRLELGKPGDEPHVVGARARDSGGCGLDEAHLDFLDGRAGEGKGDDERGCARGHSVAHDGCERGRLALQLLPHVPMRALDRGLRNPVDSHLRIVPERELELLPRHRLAQRHLADEAAVDVHGARLRR
mmetsp:Transcript_315/g.778  ORF Transcript_315/g.778 Transcript_315/m.778 type:complete len:294 (+) Transcript_315:101-982(+)